MSRAAPDAKTWLAGVLLVAMAGSVGYSLPHLNLGVRATRNSDRAVQPVKRAEAVQADSSGLGRGGAPVAFSPPSDDAIPAGSFGEMVRAGERIFTETGAQARAFVGNDLRCASCHLDRGRLAGSAPLWAAYVAYPAFRSKNGHVNTFAERLQGCFRYSMNGKAPPLGDPVLVALESYAAFLARGAPVGENLPGRGYPELSEPPKLDLVAGAQIYAAKCALCHGGRGEGQATADGRIVFPPLWGARAYNWGAGMSSIRNAAGFIKANMPFSQGGSLSDPEAWNVAAFIDGQERPQDPRFNGSVAEIRKAHHDDPLDLYGQTVNGVVLGERAPPSGTVPR